MYHPAPTLSSSLVGMLLSTLTPLLQVSGVEHYMIVMKNIFSADGLTIHRRYDLKGKII